MGFKCHQKNSKEQAMTEEEIEQKRAEFTKNDLFKESSSPFKEFQMEQFVMDGIPLNGQNSKSMKINGADTLVIFNFKNGLIHSENDEPAVEYPNHWEYWNDGFIEKIVDAGGDTEEYWENGVPGRIEKNLSERRK